MNMSTPVWIDTDPGLDDALALAVAHQSLPVQAWITVAGNGPIDRVTRNAVLLKHWLESDARIVQGEATPLQHKPVHALEVHGEDVMAGISFPPVPDPALTRLESFLQESQESIRVIAVGPLTNWGKSLQEKSLHPRIEEIVWMGAGLQTGNVTTQAEFNAYADPTAVARVAESRIPLKIIPLDLTRKIQLREADLVRFPETGNRQQLHQIAQAMLNREAPSLHDPVAVTAMAHPEWFHWEEAELQIDCSESTQRGKTEFSLGKASSIFVAIEGEIEKIREFILRALEENTVIP